MTKTTRFSAVARTLFRVLAVIFAAAIVVQVLFAGISIFVDGTRWNVHKAIGHSFTIALLLMIILAFAGRLPRGMKWLTAGTLVLVMAQGAFAAIGGWAGAAHPVNALLIFWISLRLAAQARELD